MSALRAEAEQTGRGLAAAHASLASAQAVQARLETDLAAARTEGAAQRERAARAEADLAKALAGTGGSENAEQASPPPQ